MAEEKSDFVVKDRRIFSQEESQEKPAEEKKERPLEEPEVKSSKASESHEPPEPPLPEINFATFILSLHSSALVHLGIMENPAIKEKSKNMALAKQTIDILGVIDEKTRGNLDKDEENLLKTILHDLRLTYVKEKD
ncbi:MAG: DUF1844 domain-containing protein [Thermodesulfobacteriota bacterium]